MVAKRPRRQRAGPLVSALGGLSRKDRSWLQVRLGNCRADTVDTSFQALAQAPTHRADCMGAAGPASGL